MTHLKLMSPDVMEAPGAAAPVVETPKSGLVSLRAQLEGTTAEPAPVKQSEPAPVKPATKVPAAKEPAAVPKEGAAPVAKEIVAPIVDPGVDDPDNYQSQLSKKSQDRFNALATKKAEALYEERSKALKLVTPEIEAELTGYKARATELEAELRQLGVERSPEFKAKFVERPKAIKTELSEIAKRYELPENDLIAAIENGKAGRPKLNELLESVGILDRSEAAELIREYQKIEADRAVITKDPELAQKLLEEKRQGQMKAHVEKLISERRSALTKEVIPGAFETELAPLGIFEGEEGEKTKADLIDGMSKLNDLDLERMPAKERAAMVASAFAYKPLYLALKASKERVGELEAQLAKFDRVKPPIGGGTTPKAPVEKPKSFMDRMRNGELQ